MPIELPTFTIEQDSEGRFVLINTNNGQRVPYATLQEAETAQAAIQARLEGEVAYYENSRPVKTLPR